MSEINVISRTQKIIVDPASSSVAVISAGPVGPVGPSGGPKGDPGPPGVDGEDGVDALWVQMTQTEYDALPSKDPNTLYIIIG